MLKKANVHGAIVYYEDNAKIGIEYLSYDLQFEEAAVFFRYAKTFQPAPFEVDRNGVEYQFTLRYNKDGTYTLERRY
ncbi:MAG: hypothetical protein ACK413_00650 [Patescibacteria group bacterium]